MAAVIVLSDDKVVDKWFSLRNNAGYESDQTFLEFLLYHEEIRQKYKLDKSDTILISPEEQSRLGAGSSVGMPEFAMEPDLLYNTSTQETHFSSDTGAELGATSDASDRPIKFSVVKNKKPKKFRTRVVAPQPVEEAETDNPDELQEQEQMDLKLLKTCQLCGEEKPNLKEMHRHYKEEHKKLITFKCTKCDHKFSDYNLFKRHERILHGKQKSNKPSKLDCIICGVAYKKWIDLKAHEKTHKDMELDTYTCPHCDGKTYKHLESLKKHVRIDHSDETIAHLCDTCGKNFRNRSSLLDHQRVHKGTLFPCDICGKGFIRTKTLREHITRVHEGSVQKKWVCQVCGKLFYGKSNLKIHMRSHTGEKPFRCEICGKSFSTKQYMDDHQVIHTGLRPFACNICGKDFAHRGNVVTHKQLVHFGKKPTSAQNKAPKTRKKMTTLTDMKAPGYMEDPVQQILQTV